MLLAFRPGGGPIYWLRLDTDHTHASHDSVTLQNLAAAFKLIAWHWQ